MSEIDRKEARSLLREVVEISSVSGSEAACTNRLKTVFESHDRKVWIDDVGNLRAPGDDRVLLTSHMDTVPGEIPVRVEGDVLYGRGSVDAKGSLVAMALAAIRTGVSFVGVVEEETTSAGARHLVNDRDPPEALINGEPSGWNAITLGYRGMLRGTYRTTTEVGHTSRPEPNAIQEAIAWWNEVEDSFDRESPQTIEQVTPKPVEFHGARSADGFEFEAQVDAQFRIPFGKSVSRVKRTVESVSPGELAWEDEIEPVSESPRNPVVTALRRGIRLQEGDPSHLRKTGTSDMNVFAQAWDIPMATYGPGDSSFDHTPNEHLELDEFDQAVEVLVAAANTL